MKNKIKLLDRAECLTLLLSRASNYWSKVTFFLNIPLVLTSSAMCIINSISTNANDVKIPNIVVNAVSVLVMSIISNLKSSEKYDKFKRLSQHFLELSQEIDAIEEIDIEIEKYNILVLKYENLIRSCDFEDIPGYIKNNVSMLFINNNRNVPIQLNGVTGTFNRNSNNKEINISLAPMSELV